MGERELLIRGEKAAWLPGFLYGETVISNSIFLCAVLCYKWSIGSLVQLFLEVSWHFSAFSSQLSQTTLDV